MRFPSIKSVKSSRLAASVSSDASTLLQKPPVVSGGLTVLHPPDDDGTALVDIITVHGLSGHPQNTWTNFDTQHYWPLESLPGDVPRARIMAFGYSSTVSPFNQSTAIVSDVAKQLISHLINKRTSQDEKQRPIIFIAHSLGGIVVKEFLHVASNTGHEELASCLCGILFLGTPHKGSHLASFMGVISDVVRSLLGRSADAIIEDLSSNSRHLLELDQLLRFKLAKVDIYSFYELLPLKPLSRPVVERHSALLNIPSELEQIGLEADHRQMCRPPDRNHFIYETIAQRILSIMNRQIHKAQYASDLVEMTNNFATRHMEDIAVLTKQLHECQIGSELTPMVAVLQHTVSLQVSHSKVPEKAPVSGFEEVLRSLPIHEIKSFVNGIQMLMERARSIQDLILMTERENESRRAEARIKAERQASEQRIRELEAENAHLKAVVKEQQIHALGIQSPFLRPAGVKKGKARRTVRLSDDPTWELKPSATASKDGLSELSDTERDSALGDRDPGPYDDALEDSIESPGSPGKEIGYKPSLKFRKRPLPPTMGTQQTIRRAKRQSVRSYGSTGQFNLDENHFQPRRGSDHIGSPTNLENLTGGTMSTHEESPPYTWTQNAADSHHSGPSHVAGLGTSSTAMPWGELPGQTGQASTELALDDTTCSQSSIEPEPPAAKRGRKKAAWPRLDAGRLQANTAHTNSVEPEPKPAQNAQRPSDSMMTTQESKLVENMEQMQGMVEKLSLLLQVGQHAIGSHETGVMLTAQS